MLPGPIGKLPGKANGAVALVASANRAADLFALLGEQGDGPVRRPVRRHGGPGRGRLPG